MFFLHKWKKNLESDIDCMEESMQPYIALFYAFRKIRHDFANYVQTLQLFAEVENYDEKKKMKELVKKNYLTCTLTKRRVQDIIKTEFNTLLDNKSQGYHTHTLRHTSATLLYNENDIDIRIIKEMLGHSSLASTEIYTQVSNKKLKEFMQNFSILDIEKEKEK